MTMPPAINDLLPLRVSFPIGWPNRNESVSRAVYSRAILRNRAL
jgi:hypothetical protein